MRGAPLITATDGNHGYGVAWIASQLPSPCHVLMPKGSAIARVERTRKLGAHVRVRKQRERKETGRKERRLQPPHQHRPTTTYNDNNENDNNSTNNNNSRTLALTRRRCPGRSQLEQRE